jgi:hypothetical protein
MHRCFYGTTARMPVPTGINATVPACKRRQPDGNCVHHSSVVQRSMSVDLSQRYDNSVMLCDIPVMHHSYATTQHDALDTLPMHSLQDAKHRQHASSAPCMASFITATAFAAVNAVAEVVISLQHHTPLSRIVRTQRIPVMHSRHQHNQTAHPVPISPSESTQGRLHATAHVSPAALTWGA